MEQVHLGLIGGGTVGGGVYRALQRNGKLLSSRLGISLKVAGVAVRDTSKKRSVHFPPSLLTEDWKALVNHPKIKIVVELMGGTTLARQVVIEALKQGKPVVTANKALISAHGEELFSLAKKHDTNLYYEASVAGGIPIIKVLREGLIANRITSLYGILNGTCNYILTRMQNEKEEFGKILDQAQKLGYAEAEPSLDVDGWDASHKVGILASLAHGFWVNPKHIYVEGIRHITPQDFEYAERLGYAIKLLGIVKPTPRTGSARSTLPAPIQVTVYPTLVPQSHVLASVQDVFNAVHVTGDVVGETLYYGRGAGAEATASAVVSDLADASLDLKWGACHRIAPFEPHEMDGSVLPIDEVVIPYYIRLSVVDRPGTLARISQILAQSGIGISSVFQPEVHAGKSVPLIMMIHDAPHKAMQDALKAIADLNVVKAPPMMIRGENFDAT